MLSYNFIAAVTFAVKLENLTSSSTCPCETFKCDTVTPGCVACFDPKHFVMNDNVPNPDLGLLQGDKPDDINFARWCEFTDACNP